jgi:hypothetical protein
MFSPMEVDISIGAEEIITLDAGFEHKMQVV